MADKTSRSIRYADLNAGDNAETRRLIDAGNRLADEVARLFPSQPDIADRHYWLEAMINHVPDYIYAKDTEGRFLIANEVTVADNGLESLQDLVGKTDFDLHPHEFAQAVAGTERRVLETGEPIFGIEERAIVTKGRDRWLMTSKVPLRSKSGKIIGIVGISRDITDRKSAERLLEGQARLLEMIAKGKPLTEFFNELVLLIEALLPGIKGSILLLSEDGRHLLHGAAPSLDRAYSAAVHALEIGPNAGSCGTAAWRGEQVIVSDVYADPLWADYALLLKSSGLRSCWSTPILSRERKVLGTFALYAHEVATPCEQEQELIAMAAHLAGIAIERKRAEDRISFLAHHDALTGLPNRVLFEEQVDGMLEEIRERDQCAVLAFLDLDNFKLINDSLGHAAGDELLKAVAGRMRASVRKADFVVRVGGDEFIILLNGLPKERDIVLSRLEDIRSAIAMPLQLQGRSLQVSCSMGVACFPNQGRTAGELLANADMAMYRAKELGRDNIQVFTEEMAARAHERLQWQEELREALAGEEFLLHFQPQMNLGTGRIFAAEALLRWNHPVRGIISPSVFIPLAEETGLIVPIGDWALRAACRQLKAWQDAGLPPLIISVNVSARQFRERNWASRVAEILKETGLEARYLELELTESLIMQDVPGAIATMHALEAIGVHLAIDDFGTGYSSLSALKRFPVRRLKIDRSFVTDIPLDADDMAITSAIISLAQKLGLRVIAEGVESEAQVEFLQKAGCDEIQGYFFSRPLSAEAFESLLSSARP
ncbi:EAL domain-containing protein [Sinorhizobium medicae]|uniref:Diguanylate cyclase/phosphodiesterase with PAS/PAC and GAF sensor(S) n=3 Tax=Sinorhizobium medicae TaxID=110321 RepID=A6U700_SINMW|nr:EAL domain-containing protein [Sinorhizobium medicae]ABR59430.1 diguanylate cyclase/phosphodiesterase with PAS/PAC and GAF sensor(s) [Sinorhizobium medicae WSM419]MBO1939487.1 EAL domain-containing protein [Sinorhizobium medicae]MBO1963285.1 EAL domain-containing protein [Sinorhizobium medicae]MDX0404058.1 EAL domain-containing protein [Sinorhizobium medicae]MDX0409934.1 EAL domain-containing protein [Sinorhizobium medicae]